MTKKLLLIALICLSVKLFAQAPVLSNFRVENSQKSRVYFDSNIPLTGSGFSGFIVSGKTISGVTISSGQLTGHYFTVSSSFSYWDNNTIRYEGGSNIKDDNGNSLIDITLTYIKNTIPEPSLSGNVYYVDRSSGSDSNSGTSEGQAWRTIQEAFNSAKSGDKVWIKAGNYGNENIRTQRAGSASNPIVFEGYKNSIGDITSNYWTPYSSLEDVTSLPLDANEMPLLVGNDPDANNGIEFYNNHDFIIIKNIQLRSYFNGVLLKNNDGIVFKNINLRDIGVPEGASSNAFDTSGSQNSRFRFEDCIVVNAEHAGWWLTGTNHLVKNCEVYYDLVGTDNFDYGCDYPFMLDGSHHVVIDSKIHYKVNQAHLGHGFNMKYVSEYNLVDNCLAINTTGYKTRYTTARYNVIKNSEAHANVSHAHPSATGINMLNDPNNNIYENMYIHDLTTGIYAAQNTEDPTTRDLAHDNIIRNSVFANISEGIFLRNEAVPQVSAFRNNKIYNNTFYKVTNLFAFATRYGGVSSSGNEFKNNIVHSVTNKDKVASSSYLGYTNSSGFEIDYNNFYNGFPATGTNALSVDPEFVNSASGNFELQPSSQLIDAGIELSEVPNDFEGNSRPQGSSHDMGAFEKKNGSTSTVNANAGTDVTICNNSDGSPSTTTLTASGGSSFLWSTGETTASIDVSPTVTTEYTVTVSEGSDFDSDKVIVTVNEPSSVDLGSDQSICYGETVTLMASGIGDFLWNTGETTASITVNPTTTTTYSVTASNSCATDATDDIIVNVNPEIGLTVGNDISICIGENTTLTATGNGDFLWNTGETTPSITVQPNSTTTYTVASSLGACTENASILVTVNEPSSVDLGSDQSICYGETVTLTATGTGNFLWNTGETAASITVNPSTTTTYTVTASNSCATDATDDIIVNVNPEIGLTVGSDISICIGESTTLTATGNGDFLWNTGETTSSITVQPNSTTTYTVTSSLGACTENESILVTVNEPPSVDLGADPSICYGEAVTLTANGAGDFLWSTGDTTASITVNPTITTTYSVIASNACTDAMTDEITVNVNPEIGLTVGSDISICIGESTTLTATGNGDFLWNTGETTSSITVQPNSTTTYTVTSSLGACTENESVLVTVGESPSVDLGVNQSICLGESVTLTATGAGNFLWSTGETTSSITVNPTNTTIYNVIASNGCNESVSDDVTVVINDIPEVNAGSDITIVSGTTTELTATGQGSFLWSTGETTASILVNPTNTTIFSVTLTSSEGCSSTDNIEVAVQVSNTEINADAGPDQNICPDFPDTMLTANGGDSYLWSTGETTKSISVNPTVTTVYIVEVFKDSVSSSDDVTVFIDEKCNNVLDLEAVVYPNPTEGLLNINVPDFSEKMNISIFNLNGQIVYAKSFEKTSNGGQLSHQINLSRFGKGVYIVRFSNRYQSSSKKVLVI